MADEKSSAQEPIIFLDNISVTFKTRTGSILHPNLVHAVNGLTLKLMPGETIGLVGESGCGKSTTANVMCGLQVAHERPRVLQGRGRHQAAPPSFARRSAAWSPSSSRTPQPR